MWLCIKFTMTRVQICVQKTNAINIQRSSSRWNHCFTSLCFQIEKHPEHVRCLVSQVASLCCGKATCVLRRIVQKNQTGPVVYWTSGVADDWSTPEELNPNHCGTFLEHCSRCDLDLSVERKGLKPNAENVLRQLFGIFPGAQQGLLTYAIMLRRGYIPLLLLHKSSVYVFCDNQHVLEYWIPTLMKAAITLEFYSAWNICFYPGSVVYRW